MHVVCTVIIVSYSDVAVAVSLDDITISPTAISEVQDVGEGQFGRVVLAVIKDVPFIGLSRK